MSMGVLVIRCVGLVRAQSQIILEDIAYEMRRFFMIA
jgi:hypothetical protein